METRGRKPTGRVRNKSLNFKFTQEELDKINLKLESTQEKNRSNALLKLLKIK
ncbi:hypothetical protein STFE110948_02830 [Streptobacillus felis]|uniref:hypothetical protein n=1 Tax=Streptobacillus felis TaxID=1384509 RepID=UPI000A747866|nr:hypothetical protein [Streptobacillus felis]